MTRLLPTLISVVTVMPGDSRPSRLSTSRGKRVLYREIRTG